MAKPKYRRLTMDELQELEKEFVRFLASHSITADDWVELKENDIGKAEGLLDIYSDIVFGKILSDVKYMEHRLPKMLRSYRLDEDRVLMFGLVVDENSSLDFTRDDSPQEMLARAQASAGNLRLFSAQKEYGELSKERAAFELLEEGVRINKSGTLFETLSSLAKQ